MSNYVNDLNDLITAKSEIKNIIQNTLNENPSEVFSYYPSYIARIAEAAGGDLSYYVTYSYLYSYVGDALSDIGVDLSSYVTKTELSSQSYTTTGDVNLTVENATTIEVNAGGGEAILSDWKDVLEESGLITPAVGEDEIGYDIMDIHQHIDTTVETWLNLSSYVTQAQLSNAGYLTSIPNTYPTYTAIENMAYITMADVSACGYATTTDLSNHLPYLGTLQAHYTNSEHFLPKANSTYYLGNTNFKWQRIYTYNLYSDSIVLADSYNSIDNSSNTRINFKINQNNRFKMTNVEFAPVSNSGVNLGTNSEHFKNTYSYNYYTGFNTALTSNSDYNLQFSINGVTRFGMDTVNFFPNGNGNKNLGTTANQWAYTYTKYLIIDGTDIMSIIGDVETLLANI